jgi:hypothetical protein
MLVVSASFGLFSGIRELSQTMTPLQRSVSTGVLIYGIAGLAAAIALLARHKSAIWLAVVWGLAVTYVSSLAAIAYAGDDATVVGAIAGGMGTALIAAAVIWAARLTTRRDTSAHAPGSARPVIALVLLLASGATISACRQLYGGPPVVMDRGADRMVTKAVRAKREPDRLIAEDLTVCWVAVEVFAGIKPGDHWRCEWRVVPRGQ